MTKLHELADLGQAIWLDFIRRSFITTGELNSWVDQGLRGVTSNPTIFKKAIADSTDYDEDLQQLVHAGKSVAEIYEALVIDDIQRAADVLLPVYEITDGLHGYVSLEVNPNLAHDTESTIDEARRLFAAVERPNVMIKVPATPAGIPAMELLISEGVNVNVTLMFSLEQYVEVANGYIAGVEKLISSGGDAGKIASVASFFVSRIDTAVDGELEKAGNDELRGKIAIDNAKIAYAQFKEIFGNDRWRKLAVKGGRVQRPLWASTSTKNPDYPDTLYVDNLIGRDTVNTLPPDTLAAFMDHGKVHPAVETDVAGARRRIAKLAELDIDLDFVTRRVLDQGVQSFADSFNELTASISERRKELLEERRQSSAGFGS